MGPDLVDILRRTEAYLTRQGIDAARLEAELLVAHVLGLERLELYLKFDRPFAEAELDALRPLVARRGRREPMAYILGHRGFHDIDLVVHPDTLVPRPDTETLVEAALGAIDALDRRDDPVFVADVGCGTGAVGLAIAHARPQVRLYATDVSEAALANTRENVERLDLRPRVAVLQGDLLAPIPADRPVDVVVSNPPYIPSGDIDGLMPEVGRHEPRAALDGGADGLDVVRRLLSGAVARARHGLLVEIGHDQADAAIALFTDAGLGEVRTHTDLAGIRRVVSGITVTPVP